MKCIITFICTAVMHHNAFLLVHNVWYCTHCQRRRLSYFCTAFKLRPIGYPAVGHQLTFSLIILELPTKF